MNGRPAARRLAGADAGDLADLHASALPDPWDAASWVGFLSEPTCAVLGVRDDRRLVGAMLIRTAGGESEILTIAVAPDARRQGHATGLLSAALDEAANRGAATAFLEVAVDNPAAVALYRRAGFVEIGRRRGYYRRRQGAADALIMRRSLVLDGNEAAT
jgi:ribosomal-protein-alanine N-acetyltransferase